MRGCNRASGLDQSRTSFEIISRVGSSLDGKSKLPRQTVNGQGRGGGPTCRLWTFGAIECRVPSRGHCDRSRVLGIPRPSKSRCRFLRHLRPFPSAVTAAAVRRSPPPRTSRVRTEICLGVVTRRTWNLVSDTHRPIVSTPHVLRRGHGGGTLLTLAMP